MDDNPDSVFLKPSAAPAKRGGLPRVENLTEEERREILDPVLSPVADTPLAGLASALSKILHPPSYTRPTMRPYVGGVDLSAGPGSENATPTPAILAGVKVSF